MDRIRTRGLDKRYATYARVTWAVNISGEYFQKAME